MLSLKELENVKELMSEFGITLSDYYPGVRGVRRIKKRAGDDQGIHIDGRVWDWLRPLLEELRAYRSKHPGSVGGDEDVKSRR